MLRVRGSQEGGELRSRMETIETYIVRIYRRNRDDTRKIAGLVETVGKDEKKSFTSQEELWRILNLGKKEMKQNTGKRKGGIGHET